MKKQFFLVMVLAASYLLPTHLFAQSTQGTDFWVTLMRGDEKAYDKLSLTFAAKDSTKVYIANEYADFIDSVTVGNDTIYQYPLNDIENYCYVTDLQEEQPTYRALHITSKKPISLIAANYKNKSFDVAAILPTPSLMSEYRIQCYTPSAHADNSQGSHFAIVAADDNVVVDITPTAGTQNGHPAGITYATDTLKKGQVYYVWTGYGNGIGYDFTGTEIKARDNKKIAVFNGNSHTNIPSNIRDRDHVYSQAMPVNYWGKRFAITSSLTTIDGQAEGTYWERIDKVRVQALVDGTVVKIDGDTAHIFDFVNGSNEDKKHFFEFDFGKKDGMTAYDGDGHKWYDGVSHYIETSCPSAVHLFMTSDRYDHKNGKYCNGDPSEIWVNPIEQRIDTLTFGTFETNLVTDHFINIVTSAINVGSVRLDGADISDQFNPLNGNSDYVYARITNVENKAHTLTSDSGFIAHVYGFGEKESYGYPAGGNTKDLTAFITINGKVYRPDSDNKICGDDKVVFGCELNYEYDSIYWYFGDEKDTLATHLDSIEHFYPRADLYKAYVIIYRHMGDEDNCINFAAYDSIAFHVNIGNYKIDIDSVSLPYCSKKGDVVDLTVYLSNPAGVSLSSDSVEITFDATSKAAGFDEKTIRNQGDSILYIPVPAGANDGVEYGFHLHIGSECPNSVLDKDLHFTIEFDVPMLEQRYNNVLGLRRDSFDLSQQLVDLVWFHDGIAIPGQITSVLYLDESNPQNNGEYYVCYTIKESGKADKRKCTCPVRFTVKEDKHNFNDNPDDLIISATYIVKGQTVYVNADWKGKTDIECFAQWINASGDIYQDLKFNIPDGGCTIPVPDVNGFYILRVTTDGSKRSFKFIINH